MVPRVHLLSKISAYDTLHLHFSEEHPPTFSMPSGTKEARKDSTCLSSRREEIERTSPHSLCHADVFTNKLLLTQEELRGAVDRTDGAGCPRRLSPRECVKQADPSPVNTASAMKFTAKAEEQSGWARLSVLRSRHRFAF